MNLNIADGLFNNIKEKILVKELIKNLEENINTQLKKEDVLYQVIDFCEDGVYLQNTENGIIEKETELPEELIESLSNDVVLRFKDGKYTLDEQETEKFLNSLVDIGTYSQIKNDFLQNNDLNQIDESTLFTIASKDEKYTELEYNGLTIDVPNELIPYWSKIGSKLNYKDGKFGLI